MDLNELIDRTHFDYEQNETKAKQLEERILKVPGMSKSYLPKRQYGEQYKGNQLGITASSLIVKGDNNVSGIIVAGKYDEKLYYAQKMLKNIEVFLYEVNFKLNEYKR